MKGEYDAKKQAVKELERQKKQLDEKLKPLEDLKKATEADPELRDLWQREMDEIDKAVQEILNKH